jgi:hypothetical protein
MTLLPTEPTVNTLSPDRVRLLIHGAPGAGKTTFAANWNPGRNLIIDLEGGTRFIQGAHVVRPTNFTEFAGVVDELVAGGSKFQTVTVDTLNALGRIADREAGQRYGKITAGVVEYGKGTADRDATIFRSIQKLIDSDLGLILVSHSVQDEDESGNKTWVPSVHQKEQRPFYMGVVDFMWFARRSGPTGDLVTQPNKQYEVKSRLSVPSPLPLDAAAAYKALATACAPNQKKEG